MKSSVQSRPQTIMQGILENLVQEGDCVIDGTVGNGHDTLFLAKLVGHTGSIHGFDIQAEAIAATQKRLEDAGIMGDHIQLYHCSHDQIGEKVPGKIKAAVFNLGFLPGGDKSIITMTDSTLPAIAQACEKCLPNGVISIMCYPGHAGGDKEALGVETFLSRLPHARWRVAKYQILNTSSPAPFQICAFRLDD